MSPQSLLLIVLVLMLVGAIPYRMPSKRRDFALRDGLKRAVRAVVSRGASIRVGKPAQPGAPSDIPLEDWDDLFAAVKSRLRDAVGHSLADATEPQLHDAAGQLQAILLECAEALDQLRATSLNEFGRQAQSVAFRHRCQTKLRICSPSHRARRGMRLR